MKPLIDADIWAVFKATGFLAIWRTRKQGEDPRSAWNLLRLRSAECRLLTPARKIGMSVRRVTIFEVKITNDFLETIESRLPWSALAPYLAAAERHGIKIRTDSFGHQLALKGIAEHLMEMGNGAESEARVLMAIMTDEALTFTSVVISESVISHVVSRGKDWRLSQVWMAEK